MLAALIALAARTAASPIDAGAEVDGALDDRDLLEPLPDALPDDDEAARTANDAGAALLEASFATVTGATELDVVHDAQLRPRRPSAWGRIDLSLAWRSTERDLQRSDEVWLVASWRR